MQHIKEDGINMEEADLHKKIDDLNEQITGLIEIVDRMAEKIQTLVEETGQLKSDFKDELQQYKDNENVNTSQW